MMRLKAYEKPRVTTVDSATILDQIGPAQAAVSGAQDVNPYYQLSPESGGGSGQRFGQ